MDELHDPYPVMTVGELRDILYDIPDETPVMVAVVKRPDLFFGDWLELDGDWLRSPHVEVIPVESDDLNLHDGVVTINVELLDVTEGSPLEVTSD